MNKRDEIGMQRLASVLFSNIAERHRFLDALQNGVPREQAIIVLEEKAEIRAFPKQKLVSWQPEWVHRLPEYFKPGVHPQHAKGSYYVLDLSSVFSASAMLAVETPPERVLDLCASPGGKSIFAFRAFHPAVLACNETMKRRMATLTGNLTRCNVKSAVAGATDPSVWAKKCPDGFDLVLVDAPCSGQSLLAKGDDAPDCWKPEMIDTCVGRQRRILGNAVRCTAPGGHIVYMTCTFTRKENERMVEWVLRNFEDVECVSVPALADFQSEFSPEPCYRLFPQQGFGAGAFTALLRRKPTDTKRIDYTRDEMPVSWRFGMTNFAPREATPPPEPPAPKSRPRTQSRPRTTPKRRRR